jgi:hypothetical protein
MDADQPLQIEIVKTPEELVEESIFPELASRNDKEPMPDLPSNYLPLKDFYGIKDLNRESQEKLHTVWEHFSKDAKNPGTVLKKIRIEQMNLTPPNVGDTSLNQMYNYIRVLQDLEAAKQMKEAYRNDSRS